MHCKNILDKFLEHNINISQEKLTEVLKECKTCTSYDTKRIFTGGHVITN